MVFESIVTELVNKYLGDFIENLDKSQLKIGLWGGDVVLNNLYVKESALDELDLPVKVLHGNIGKLVLKVPWKNLYTEPTVATLEGLYVVAVPNAGVKYNAEKEAKADWEKKQKELVRIEEAKRQEDEKDQKKEEKADTFAEKLASNVIKNLQVNVSDIHIRYEDHYTNPKRPFSLGVTLKSLTFQTTDENWHPKTIKEAVTMIYKVVQLQSLAVYWNPNTPSFLKQEREKILDTMKGSIASPNNKTSLPYLIEPISSSAKLTMHTKPEKDQFSIPKILLNVLFEEIAICLTRHQYHDVMELLEALERMNLSSMYRKYDRPQTPIKGGSKHWWHFAYRCVLGETVRRRRQMWSWDHIKAHRDRCRKYKELYKKKLLTKKPGSDLEKQLENLEKDLSIFSITLVRQQADMETKDKRVKQESKGGWFGGWFGGGKKKEKKEEEDIAGQFQKAMSNEEKAKLYSAIGYQENQLDPTLPKDYVAHKLGFKLNKLSLKLKDTDRGEPQVVDVQLVDVFANVAQRPAASAVRIETKMDTLTVFGCPVSTGSKVPNLVTSQNQGSPYSLLDMLIETNPLDGKCDQRVSLNARPLEIAYDAHTINQVTAFFKPPEAVYLKQIQAAALAKFEELKEQSATGLKHTIEQHKFTDISVDIQPSYVILPDKGIYRSDATMLVLDLGSLKVSSEKQEVSATTPQGEQIDLEEMLSKAFDKFNVRLEQIQLLFVRPGEDWKAARKTISNMHILKPMALDINIFKSMIEDSRMPKMKVHGELPNLSINMSDARLKEILDLIQSIPFPESEPPPPEQDMDWDAPDIQAVALEVPGDTSRVLQKVQAAVEGDSGSDSEGEKKAALKTQKSQEYVNMTDLEARFELKEICLSLSQVKDNVEVPTLKIVVNSLGTEVKIRTFDMNAAAYLGGIYIQYQQLKALNDGPLINLVNTPADETMAQLLYVEYTKANIKGPEFTTTYKNTEQKLNVHFSALEILLHQEAILELLSLAHKLQPAPAAAAPAVEPPASIEAPITATDAAKLQSKPLIKRRKGKQEIEIIDLAVTAKLDVFQVNICTQHAPITDIRVKGFEANVEMMKSKLAVQASLKDLAIIDPTPEAIYSKILSFEGGDVFKVGFTQYNGATEGEHYADLSRVDMRVEADFGCMKVVFLNKFVNNLLNFLNNFQVAMDALKEASVSAAEQAAQAAQQVAQNASRLGLNINMKAPVIVIPQSSVSHNALMADLGFLSIKNNFTAESAKNEKGQPAVLDNLSVELVSLKVMRAELHAGTGNKECLLIHPVTVRVNLTRNLSASWYHGVPEINISGHLEAFSVCMSQGDFGLIMKVLNENLTEGATPPPAPAAAQPAVEGAVKPETATTVQASAEGEIVPAQADVVQAAPGVATGVYSKMKFSFRLETINATLYSGDSDLKSGSTSERETKNSLAKFDMKTIAVEGEMKTDNSMSAKVILHNIVLDDTRPSRADGITKMIERSQRDLSFEHMTNMIDVEFKQDDKMNKNGVVKVNSLYICVCLDFLMQLGDFFTKGMADSQPPAAPATPAVTETTGTSAGAMEPVKPAAAEPAKPPEGEFVLSLSVEHPEIIMVENSKDLNTKALILDTQVKAKVRISPEQQQISGEVADLRIYSCQFSTLQEGTKTMILHPCTISLHSNAPFGKGQHVDINLTDIVMDITPATIRQITATLSSLSPQPEEGTVDHLAGIPKKLWDIQKLEECNFQFLQTVRDQQAVGLKDEVVPVEPRGEQLLMAINKITVKLEGGVGTRTLPLLIVEMGFKAEVKDWSTKLYVSSDIHMEVAYYNEKLAVWEPVLEPVQTERGASRPWELGIEVEANDELPPITDDDDTEVIITPPPKMTVTIQSQELLEITLTKSCLEVLGNLGKAFGDAYNLVEAPEKMDVALAPYAVRNDSGLSVSLRLDESFMPPTNSHEGIVQLMPGDLLDLNNAEQKVTTKAEKSVIKATQDKDRRTLMIMLEEFGVTRELHIMRAEQRVFQINQRTYGNETWALLCQTEVSYGRKTVSLRSILQVQNQLQVAMEVYYKLGNDAMGRCGEIDAGQMLNVPLEAVYAAPFELYFKPRGPQYQESSEPVTWKDMEAGSSTTLSCSPYKPGPQNFFFNVSLSMEDVFFEATGEKTAKSHTLTLKPCAVFYNLLPIPVSVLLEGCADEIEVGAGEKTVFLNAEMGKTHVEVRIMKYQGREWSGKRLLEDKFKELTVWTFESSEGTSKDSMDLGLHCVKDKGYHEWSLYCPYWIINKTGRLLSYKGTDESCVTQAADSTEALLFSFKSKSILGKKKGSVTDEDTMVKASTNSSPKKAAKAKKIKKKTMKASLKIDDSDWSDKFSLDTVGSAGIVSCKLKGAPQEANKKLKKSELKKLPDLKVGVNITLASSGLTKIVVFTPYFLLVNQAQFAISCRENVDDAPWYDLEPGECKPYWQFVSGKKVQMLAKVKDTDVTTKPFMITQAHTTLLTLEHEYQCINVECTVMEATIHVTFDHFKPGMAAVCLVNHTSGTTISYKQHGQGEFSKLGPQESVLYTWQDPLEKREFIWSAVEKKENKHDLVKDGIGDIFLDSDHKLYWVSFLDGMQRVILFTEDLALATIAQQAGELERIDMETILALKGLGLSLVNNYVRKEVAYLGITSSGVVWEEKKRRRFKALKAKHSRIIEAAWDKYQNQLIAGKASPGRIQLESKIELDFNTMQMFKPRKCTIRRSYENGIWLQYRQSPHQQQFHAKIHRLQLDSQMPGVIFQTVLSPIPPPKSVAAESVPKPFTEMSVMIRKRDHTTVLQFKYFKILTQEMALKVDQIFLNSIIEMFASGEVSEEQKKEAFDADTKMIDSKLVDEASKASETGQKHFYDDLHISPLKVHISFSMYSGGEEKKQAQLHSNVINLFLQSVGVVLSDVQDVVFKLGYFERKHSFYNQSQLVSEATVHYTGQAIKQMYVLVLGLDVLGNPFGVVRGLAEGIEDLFYEPYQGAIQGPEEFAEGLALGVRSLLGHAVGGAAGAVSRITGALGKGIATLTFDEDYQRKRREQLNKQPTGLKEGLAQGGKGLVMGVFDGVTGIVRKPVEGAKQEGVEGFFKGMGKGLVGVFTRPASGVVDFASTSFEGLRRTADMAGEVRRIRPPRYLQPDGIVRPYNHMEAEGNGILQDLEKGKYSLTDEYQGHVVVTKDGKNILLVTDLRVVFVNRGQIFGQWDCEWQYTWADLKEKPTTTSKGVQILLREKQKKSIFHSSTVGKLVPMDNKEAAEWIVGKMVDAMTKAK